MKIQIEKSMIYTVNYTTLDTSQTVKEEASIHLVGMKMMIFWSALPDLNRGPPDGCLQPCVSSLQSGALAN